METENIYCYENCFIENCKYNNRNISYVNPFEPLPTYLSKDLIEDCPLNKVDDEMKKSSVSSRIKSLLINVDKTQSDLARYLGVSRESISQMLSKNKIPEKHHERIANFLGVKVEDLFIDDLYVEIKKENEKVKEIISFIQSLSKQHKIRIIKEIIDTL